MPHEFPPEDDFEPGTGALARALFPAGPADGKAFLARHEEFRRLLSNVTEHRHAWFDCPARFGVGTLVHRARRSLRYHRDPRVGSIVCDLAQVHDSKALFDSVLDALGQLAAQTMRRPNVVAEKVAAQFPGMQTEVCFDDRDLQTIRFHIGDNAYEDALLRVNTELERLCAEAGCRHLLVVRNLQQALGLKNARQHLATLAAVVGASRSTSWAFHGQNQFAMRQMFDDTAPLGEHCRRFRLHPVDADIYRAYLADAAQAQWGCKIGRKAMVMLLALPRRHTYWMSELCRSLWSRDLPPLLQNIVENWNALVQSRRHGFVRELERLSPNQRAVLVNIARTPTAQPRAKEFVRRTRVSSASVGQAIAILQAQDLVATDLDGTWHVRDPALQWYLEPDRQLVADIYEGIPVPL